MPTSDKTGDDMSGVCAWRVCVACVRDVCDIITWCVSSGTDIHKAYV